MQHQKFPRNEAAKIKNLSIWFRNRYLPHSTTLVSVPLNISLKLPLIYLKQNPNIGIVLHAHVNSVRSTSKIYFLEIN